MKSPPYSALLASLSLTTPFIAFSTSAEAIIVTVNGAEYDIQIYTGSYISNPEFFTTNPTNNSAGYMPWLNDPNLASTFALALFNTDPRPHGGLPGNTGSVLGYGPLFATNYDLNNNIVFGRWVNNATKILEVTSVNGNSEYNYAYAQTGATPVPFESDALPVVGSALFMAGGLWWKKQRNQAKLTEFTAKK